MSAAREPIPPTAPAAASGVALPYLLLALASLCWAGNHVLGRAISGSIPPLAISTIRWAVPTMLLAPFAIPHLVRDWAAIRAHLVPITLLAALGGGVFGALQYIGLQHTTAINVSVLNSLSPVLIAIAAALLFGERLSVAQGLGVAISLAGVLAIVCRGDFGELQRLSFNQGDLIIIFNMVVFGVYSACLRVRPKIHWLSWMFMFSAISTLVTLPWFVIEHRSGNTLVLSAGVIAALGYASIFPSLVANVSWNRGVELIGVNRAGATLHLVAVFSAVLSTAVLGEKLMWFHFAGFVLIIAGVWLAARPAAVKAA